MQSLTRPLAFAVAALTVALTAATCSDPAGVVVAEVLGTVTVDGEPLGNVSVRLEGGGNSFNALTDAEGQYRFAGTLELTNHTLSLVDPPAEASFPFTSTTLEISASPFQTTVDFEGTTQ